MTSCCDEPTCRRTQPLGLQKAAFSGKWYVVTKSRPFKTGSPVMVAIERHELPIQAQVQLDQMRDDSAWLQGLLSAMEMTKDQLADHLGVHFSDKETTA